MSEKKKRYLGDSVYVTEAGYGITLTTENGRPDDPSNSIMLEPIVMDALIVFINNYVLADGKEYKIVDKKEEEV